MCVVFQAPTNEKNSKKKRLSGQFSSILNSIRSYLNLGLALLSHLWYQAMVGSTSKEPILQGSTEETGKTKREGKWKGNYNEGEWK